MNHQGLTHNLGHCHAGIQACIWILKDHLHLAAHLTQFFAFQM